jgi:hypothetical protein
MWLRDWLGLTHVCVERRGSPPLFGAGGTGTVSGSTTNTLLLSGVLSQQDEGIYQLTATNSCGAVTTLPIIVTFDTLCVADWNVDGVVRVQDIFDYVTDWQSQSTGGPVIMHSADVNGDDDVTVQDLFDFIALWSAGC